MHSKCHRASSSIPVQLEIEVQLQDAAIELTPEAVLLLVVPLLVHDLEGHVLVRRACVEADDEEVSRVCGLQVVRRRDGLVDEVRVEDVELVALHALGRRVVVVVVRLIVLVPVVAGLDTVEVPGLQN